MRLRPLWRIPAYLLLCLCMVKLIQPLSSLAGMNDPFLPALLGVTFGTWLALKKTDGRELADLGLKWQPASLPDLLIGLGIPVFLISAILAAEWFAGWLLVAGMRPAGPMTALDLLWRCAAVAWYEELLARGYLLQTFLRSSRPWPANLLAAGLFAGFHLLNPHVTVAAMAGVYLAGVFLGWCYQWTGSLILPMAFHFSWNLTQAALGFPVSGSEQPGFLRVIREGPALWTGGRFGPEAGLLGFAAILLAAGVIREYCRNTRPPALSPDRSNTREGG